MHIKKIDSAANQNEVRELQSPVSKAESENHKELFGLDLPDEVEVLPEKDLIDTLVNHAEEMTYREAVIDDATDGDLVNDLITHAENMRYREAVIDADVDVDPAEKPRVARRK